MKKHKTIGIDARMCGKDFTGIGRLTERVIKGLPTLMKEFDFVLFLNELTFKKFKNKPQNVKKILCLEKIYSLSEQTLFLKKIKQHQCDLMYFLHFNVPLLYQGKFITTIHDLTLFDFPGKKMNKWWQRAAFKMVFHYAIKKAQKIITVSEFTKNHLIKIYPSLKEKSTVVYNGINDDFFNFSINNKNHKKIQNLKNKLKIKQDFFLYTGVWREHKNLKRLLQAFLLLKKEGLKANLVITGKKSETNIINFIKENNLQKEVILTGLLDEKDLLLLFKAAKIFVFPSLAEGFGIPPLEAMALKIPVCSSNATSLPEVCSNAALFFDPYSINDIAKKMKKLFSNEALQKDLIQKGLQRVQNFKWDKALQKIKKIITEII